MSKIYAFNNSLVQAGNNLLAGEPGGSSVEYKAGPYISIEDNEISVTGISASGNTLSIVQNVTGAPLDIIYPTDVAPDAVFYQINSVSGNAYATSSSNAVINYYYGETPADFNGSGDSILFTINDAISNIGTIYFYYTTAETGMGGPSLTTTSINGGSTGIVQSGTYKLKAQYNQAGTSSPYGKYLQIMFNWRNYASDAAQSMQWAQEALSKITFFGIARPDSSLGVTVNLDRYYLGGNVVTNKPTNSGLPAQIWLNPETKKQEVYLPNSVPSSWNIYGNSFINYTSTPSNISGGFDSTIAYKYNSTNDKYIYARMTCCDRTNKKAEFVTLEPVNGNFEKWTYDWYNSSNRHWTTETINDVSAIEAEIQAVSGALDDYIPYSASGVYLPDSKFEIDTEGQAYKVISEGSETAYNVWDDGGLYFNYAQTQLGTYIATLPPNTDHLEVHKEGGIELTYTVDSTTLTAVFNITSLPNNSRAWIYAVDSNNEYLPIGPWASPNTTAKRVVYAVKDEYITESAVSGLEADIQTYVQNYTIPVQVVASSAAATGTDILYIVTGE